jgi:endonuclease/exonuclease/phosphatase family metal-dependent hydrolase
MKERYGKGAIIIIPLIIIGTAAALILLASPFIVSGLVEAVPESFYFEQNVTEPTESHENCVFSVLTLNIGHGRGSGMHQLFQSRKRITANADKTAEVLSRENISIAGLQEVDGPGFWNGGLDLIEYLAENSGYPHGVWTKNVETPALSYGTALLSSLPYSHAVSYTFKARPFVLPKGFTLGFFRVSERTDRHVCVVSVHLAPALSYMRKKQVKLLLAKLEDVEMPIVVMGDFNCGWREGSALRLLAERKNLTAWRPYSEELGSHSLGDRRLDWILISEGLEFLEYQVIDNRLSDHKAVKAVIRCSAD